MHRNIIAFAINLAALLVPCWGCVVQPNVRPISNTSSMGGTVSGFPSPYMGGGRVLFSAFESKQPVLLVYDGEEVVQRVSPSTPIIGSPGSSRFAGFGSYSIPHDGDKGVVFTATVSTAEGSVDGVYFAFSGSEPAAVPLVTTANGSFTSFSEISVAASKDGTILVSFIASKATSKAVYVSELQGTSVGKMQKLVETGDIIPGSSGLTFLCLESTSISSTGEVAFFGSHCSDATSSAIAAQQAKRSMFRTRHRQSHCLHLGRDHVFPGIFRTAIGEKVQVVASAATSCPGQNGTFVGFSSGAIGADGTIAFVGEGPLGLGIFAQTPKQALRLVADDNPANGKFSDFPEEPSVGRGRVAFYAATGTGTGVYIEGSGSAPNFPPSVPQALLTSADTAVGSEIVYIGFGTHAYNEASGEVAVYLVLDNKAETDGVYAVTPSSCEINKGIDLVTRARAQDVIV